MLILLYLYSYYIKANVVDYMQLIGTRLIDECLSQITACFWAIHNLWHYSSGNLSISQPQRPSELTMLFKTMPFFSLFTTTESNTIFMVSNLVMKMAWTSLDNMFKYQLKSIKHIVLHFHLNLCCLILWGDLQGSHIQSCTITKLCLIYTYMDTHSGHSFLFT